MLKINQLYPVILHQEKDPWNRIYYNRTLASTRRCYNYFDPSVPNDSLDFALKEEYDHHRDWWKSKAEEKFQIESISEAHGPFKVQKSSNTHPLKIIKSSTRPNWFSVKNAIEGCHTQITNAGYSRMPDGGIFTN